MRGGVEWIVDGEGCEPDALRGRRGLALLRQLFATLVDELGLHPVGEGQWHVFPGEAGVTGLLLLSESHLAAHTYPEAAALTLNLYSCRPRPEPRWLDLLEGTHPGGRWTVRRVERGGLQAAASEHAEPPATPAPGPAPVTSRPRGSSR